MIPLMFGQDDQFIYHGFHGANLHLHGAKIHPNGLLQLTNTSNRQVGHAFYPLPIKFNTTTSLSFSINFVFAMVPKESKYGGHGLTIIITPSLESVTYAISKYFLGLFNVSKNGLSTNHVLAIELDTVVSPEFQDIDDNHVGIDVNNLKSIESATAAYFSNQEGKNISMDLESGDSMHLWTDYDDTEKLLNVTLAPTSIPKPNWPLLLTHINLSPILLESMYIGFSAATDGALIKVDNHKALMFPSFPHFPHKGKPKRKQDY
jgi:hypothetical protein